MYTNRWLVYLYYQYMAARNRGDVPSRSLLSMTSGMTDAYLRSKRLSMRFLEDFGVSDCVFNTIIE